MDAPDHAPFPGPVEVARPGNLFEARLLAGYLEGCGIPTYIPNETMLGTMDGAVAIWQEGVPIEVPGDCAREAQRLLSEREAARARAPTSEPSPCLVSERQHALFEALARLDRLVLSVGARGVRANLVGRFRIRDVDKEHVLCVDEGTHHVHMDWSRIRRAEVSEVQGEGLLAFFDGRDLLLRLYRPAGPFPPEVVARAGDLVGPPSLS